MALGSFLVGLTVLATVTASPVSPDAFPESVDFGERDAVVPESHSAGLSLNQASTDAKLSAKQQSPAEMNQMGRIVLETMKDSEAKEALAWLQLEFDKMEVKHPGCKEKIGSLIMPQTCERQIIEGDAHADDIPTSFQRGPVLSVALAR